MESWAAGHMGLETGFMGAIYHQKIYKDIFMPLKVKIVTGFCQGTQMRR
jgi:hypothetical protein